MNTEHPLSDDGFSGYVDTPVTLNGNPAQVSGYHNDFATVTDMTTGLSCEWAWQTVAHIVKNRKGAFKS